MLLCKLLFKFLFIGKILRLVFSYPSVQVKDRYSFMSILKRRVNLPFVKNFSLTVPRAIHKCYGLSFGKVKKAMLLYGDQEINKL